MFVFLAGLLFAIGSWLLAFGFLANSQQPIAKSLLSLKAHMTIIIPLCVKILQWTIDFAKVILQ